MWFHLDKRRRFLVWWTKTSHKYFPTMLLLCAPEMLILTLLWCSKGTRRHNNVDTKGDPSNQLATSRWRYIYATYANKRILAHRWCSYECLTSTHWPLPSSTTNGTNGMRRMRSLLLFNATADRQSIISKHLGVMKHSIFEFEQWYFRTNRSAQGDRT